MLQLCQEADGIRSNGPAHRDERHPKVIPSHGRSIPARPPWGLPGHRSVRRADATGEVQEVRLVDTGVLDSKMPVLKVQIVSIQEAKSLQW